MKKISKKIVALATMAAFVLTLVPAAAFAAAAPTITDVSHSYLQTNDENPAVTVGDKVGFNLKIYSDDKEEQSAKVYPAVLWATNEDGEAVQDAAFANVKDGWHGTGVIENGTLADGQEMTVAFSKAGTYTLHAGVRVVVKDPVTGESKNDVEEFNYVEGYQTITVTDKATAVKAISVDGATNNTINYNGTPNSTTKTKATVKVDSALAGTDTSVSSKGTVVSIDNGTNDARGFSVVNAKGEAIDEVTIGANGKADFYLLAETGTKAGDYVIYLNAGDVEYKLTVKVGNAATVQSIETVDNGDAVVKNVNPDFADAVEFAFKDANGNNVVAPVSDLTFEVTNPAGATGAQKIKTGDLTVAKNEDGTYKLVVNNHKDVALAIGKYDVRIALKNGTGAHADATFTVAKPGKAVALSIVMDDNADTVVSGQTAKGTIYYVDANGIKEPVTNNGKVVIGVTSGAVAVDEKDTDNSKNLIKIYSDGRFKLTAKDDEKYIGTTISLYAFMTNTGISTTTDLTVVDGLSENTLAFDSEEGPILKDNTVNVSVVDENGKAVGINGQLYAYVESSSNEDARVDVDNNVQVTNGKVGIKVFSDKETVAKIVVAVKDNNSNAIYAGTLTYAFGEQDIPVDTTVVMTVGSSDFVVNNEVVTKEDSAPYVANDRTYVPFRALGEALGAEVEWNNDDRTVTYTLGKTEVVMTIGEKTYTINGEEKTMDVAPVITGDRTYVPVRFVGEALGFNVTALSNTDGTTASVVFQK